MTAGPKESLAKVPAAPPSPGAGERLPARLLATIGALSALAGAAVLIRQLVGGQDIDDTAARFFLVAGAVTILHRVKSLSFGDNKIEMQDLQAALETQRGEIERVRGRVKEVADDLDATGAVFDHIPRPGGSRPVAEEDMLLDVEGDRGRAVGAAPADEDPHKGKWGGMAAANDRRLCAIVVAVPGSASWFRVRLRVCSTNPGDPLTGSVTFHLHPTFPSPVVTRPVEDGEATLSLLAWGAFTVGASCDGGDTRLELDLAQLESAPEVFRSR
ncbi:hypothetical protein HY631_04425 [Candidatus Uhrbacteria bacterium]|nr:hypothetical protein [Candidatus Uhrbacteria bacterium]